MKSTIVFVVYVFTVVITFCGLIYYLVINPQEINIHYPYNKETLDACQTLKGEVVIRLSLEEGGESYMLCTLPRQEHGK